jgi:hypothetical protein
MVLVSVMAKGEFLVSGFGWGRAVGHRTPLSIPPNAKHRSIVTRVPAR